MRVGLSKGEGGKSRVQGTEMRHRKREGGHHLKRRHRQSRLILKCDMQKAECLVREKD